MNCILNNNVMLYIYIYISCQVNLLAPCVHLFQMLSFDSQNKSYKINSSHKLELKMDGLIIW